jgi:hypothetical protein
MTRGNPRLRLCERCWHPIPTHVSCRVIRHTDPERPFLPALHSYEHVADDQSCGASEAHRSVTHHGPETPQH